MQQIRRLIKSNSSPLAESKVTLALDIFEQLSIKSLIQAFDLLPDILFWIKDKQGRIVHANQLLVEHLGFRNLEQLLGKTDFDFAPAHIARQFVTDDHKVMAGETITDRLELNLSDQGEFGWYTTSKRALFDDQGQLLGTYGVSRHLQKTSKTLLNYQALEMPVKFVKTNFAKPISIEQLANQVHLSVSALERRFKKYLGATPKQFINQVRLENARKLLVETRLPVAEIAFQCGFTEPSYFTMQFKKLFGIKPSEFRQQNMK